MLSRFLDTGAPPTERWVRQAAADRGLDAAALDQGTAIECGRLNFGALLTGPG